MGDMCPAGFAETRERPGNFRQQGIGADMAKHIIVTVLASLLASGCCIKEGARGDGGLVVSPEQISIQSQGNDGLFLEDTEHWWEVED